jgi:hypothetical protein
MSKIIDRYQVIRKNTYFLSISYNSDNQWRVTEVIRTPSNEMTSTLCGSNIRAMFTYSNVFAMLSEYE